MADDRRFEISPKALEDSAMSMMSGSNRAERRNAKKNRKAIAPFKNKIVIVQTMPLAEILDNEDDLPMLERELVVQEALKTQLLLRRRAFNAYRACGVTELTARRVMFRDGENEAGLFSQVVAESDRRQFLKSQGMFRQLQTQINNTPVFYTDSEERDLIDLMRTENFSAIEIFDEAARSRQEVIGLLGLQVGWLRRETETLLPSADPSPELSSTQPEVASPPPFALTDWNLHFSEKPWSASDSHLKEIATTSEDEAIQSIDQATRGFRSIKPGSILRALNHHLFDKDVIQKALSTRFRYAPEQERDWVKAKRGKDRIGMLIDEEAKSVVFCIEGRDIVYRKP